MLLLGSLNWVLEWFNPRMRSFDDVVTEAQNMVRYGTFVQP